jgi:hypothetical protein
LSSFHVEKQARTTNILDDATIMFYSWKSKTNGTMTSVPWSGNYAASHATSFSFLGYYLAISKGAGYGGNII